MPYKPILENNNNIIIIIIYLFNGNWAFARWQWFSSHIQVLDTVLLKFTFTSGAEGGGLREKHVVFVDHLKMKF